MPTIRPEVRVFMRAAEALIKGSADTGTPLSEEEASEIARYVDRLRDFLGTDDSL
ncbi:MAG: hypothetical protein LZF62_360021 [Nitrospira sp.]|nr:MAG: hypothetical protein LZF62_360021 [Nitrospira sp.]